MDQPIVVLEGVSKRFGNQVVLDNLNLSIAKGEFITLLGPSGCGKSTTLNIIAGFVTPDSGHVYLRGAPANDLEPRKRNLGMVFQTWALFPHMTVFDNVAFGLRMKKMGSSEIRSRVAKMLELVRLKGSEEKYPSQLSGGMRQRVALARALAVEPDILLLDEPLSNLDTNLRKEMQVEIKRIHEQLQVTAIFVTHSQEEALVLSDRVAVMNHGRIVRMDTPTNIYRDPRSAFVCRFLGEANILDARVRDVANGKMVLGLQGALVRALSDARVKKGETVSFCIRPEQISLSPEPSPDADNSVPVVVTDTIYKGQSITYYLRLQGSDTELTAEAPPRANGELFPRGAQLFAEFEAAAIRLLETE